MKEFATYAKGTIHELGKEYISIFCFQNRKAFFNSDSFSDSIIKNMYIDYDPGKKSTRLNGIISKDSVCMVVTNPDSEDMKVASESIRFFINVRGMDYTAFRKAVGKAALTAYQYFRGFGE